MADQQEDDLTQAVSFDSDDFIRIVKNRGTVPVSQIMSRAIAKAYYDTLYEPIGGGGTGWQAVTETWTRTGNHAYSVSTDLTTKYSKGTKVRYKDGGSFEYGVIGASAYSAPNTAISLITTTDYAMAAATITDTAISYQANPQGFPGWFNWAAAPTGFSAVPTNVNYRWITNGRMITLQYSEGTNGTSNATSFTCTAPVPCIVLTSGQWVTAIGTTVDNSTVQTTPGRVFILSSNPSLITLQKDSASGAWTNSGGKRVVFSLTYEF